MPTISDQISELARYTVEKKAKEPHVTGTASAQLSQSEFLELMLKQYQYQDPMEPMDNSAMVSQQCQFSQLSASQDLTKAISSNNSINQALSLVGKSVVLTDPDNAEKVISGKVDAAYVDGSNSCVTVGGKNYPLKYVLYAYDGTTTKASTDPASNGSSSGTSGTSDATKSSDTTKPSSST